MTVKLIMTTAQREHITKVLMSTPKNDDANKALAMLQSLTMVDSEPVLHIYGGEICYKSREEDQSYGMSLPATYEYLKKFGEYTKFYTSPQALTPITADDVTDEMIKAIIPISFSELLKNPVLYKQTKRSYANIYNAVLKHRSEAK